MRKTLPLALCLIALLSTACMTWADDECRFTAPREASIDVDGVSSIRVIARAGSLDITGVPGASRVEARGQACASEESFLDDIQLKARRAGDEVVIEVIIPERTGGWNIQQRLDLNVEVPADLPIRADDSSGSLSVRGVASLDLEDGSGSIDIADIAGNVRIKDGSGSIDIEGVGGDVRVDDGSGGIEITRVEGNVEVEDGSGEIDIRTVHRDVLIKTDGSGSIDVADVQGTFRVQEDGSGSIVAADIRGDFIVESDGSGGIRHRDVGGNVSIPKGD